MRVVFLGSGEFGLPTLQALCVGHEVLRVVSQPDRPAGRNRALTGTPIAQWARGRGLEVVTSPDVNAGSFVEEMARLKPEAAVVIAFGQKLSPQLIDALGPMTVNLHASLLPKFRGAAPINWAMIRGEATTGLSVIGLSQRMDGGLIYGQSSTAIDPNETAGELHDRLAAMGPQLVLRVLSQFMEGSLRGAAQDEALATRAPKLSKADGTVDFNADAEEVRNRVHGLTPWPGVRVTWASDATGESRELHLLRVAARPDLSCFLNRRHLPAPGCVLADHCVATRDGCVKLLEVQAPGGRPLKIDEFARGHALRPGDRLLSIHP